MNRALALVESPAQLLNVIELGYADPDWTSVRIAVLAPAEGQTRTQLRSMAALARAAGHPVAWYDPRQGGASVARSVRAMAGELAGVDRLVIGDPFSGLMQVIVTLTRPRQVMFVDDGTATMEFARQWVTGQHLSRWHQVATPQQRRQIASLAREQIAGEVRRRLSPESGCRLGLFTCLPAELPGADVRRNDYAWLRATYATPTVKATADLIGTSLVESGVVTPESYLTGVQALAKRYAADRYFAHRKETDDKLLQIQQLGLEVVRPTLPLEIVARSGPAARTMISFPSTVVHTLPVVLSDCATEIIVCDIDDGWFTATTSIHADGFLGQVARTAQSRHGLTAVAC